MKEKVQNVTVKQTFTLLYLLLAFLILYFPVKDYLTGKPYARTTSIQPHP
jgi:hypothetical protein